MPSEEEFERNQQQEFEIFGPFIIDPETGEAKLIRAIEDVSSYVTFKLVDVSSSNAKFTPVYLAKVVAPYLLAISRLQHIFDEVRGIPPNVIQINSISMGSVDISLDGGGEILKIIREEASPWRKENAKMMAQLTEQTVQAEIEAKKSETLQLRANAQKTRAEAKGAEAKAQAEAKLAFTNAKANAEKLQLENEMLRLQLHEKKIQLALDVIERLKIELNEVQKIDLAMKILDPLGELVESPLQLVALLEPNSETPEEGDHTTE